MAADTKFGLRLVRPKRRRVSFGFLSPQHWPGCTPDTNINKLIYFGLRKAGFRETIWQIIYRGQIGALILPLNNGKLEIHVRFYVNTIEAELEVGRHFPDHFLQPRYQAEAIVLKLLKPHVPLDKIGQIKSSFRADRLSSDIPPVYGRFKLSFNRLALVITAITLTLLPFGIIPVYLPLVALGTAYLLKLSLPSLPNTNPT